MKATILLLLVSSVVLVANGAEDDETQKETWWSGFKQKVKAVMSKWREDLKSLWTDVISKADDMRGWTRELFDAFKLKFREWLEGKKDLPDVEKNEIETFINKMKFPSTDEPNKKIDP